MNKYDTFPADFNTALQIVCIVGVWQVTVKTPVQLEASPPGTSSARILASVGEGKLSRSDRICEAQQQLSTLRIRPKSQTCYVTSGVFVSGRPGETTLREKEGPERRGKNNSKRCGP